MDTILGFFHQGFSVIVPFVVLLGVLIFVHELGHFSVAKFFGVRVEVFSLGFGRKIFSKKVGDTTYALSMIPFGGYVKMYGDDASADIPESQKKYSFSHQPVLPRIAIVLAGPLMNAIFAFFLFTAIAGIGEEVLKPKLGEINSHTEAYKDGFRTGDIIKTVNGTPVIKFENFKKIVEEGLSKDLNVVVSRDGSDIPVHAVAKTVVNKNVLNSATHIGEIDGLTYLSRASAIGISDPLSPAASSGLRTGDIIRKINGTEVTKWDEVESKLAEASHNGLSEVALEVERDGNVAKLLQIHLPLTDKEARGGIEPSDLYLSSIVPKSAAQEAGIEVGDKLVAINDQHLERWEDVVRLVQGFQPGVGAGSLKVDFLHSGKLKTVSVTPRLLSQTDSVGAEQKNYALGVVTGLAYANPETFFAREPGFGNMVKAGFSDTVHWTKLTAQSFVALVQRKVSAKSLGGPLMIGKLASETWKIGISPFLKIMGIISINLFLLNLMPIPVLDGGHLLFFGIEFVKGSPLSFRKMEVMQQVGMFLLLALMAFSMFNDIVRFFTS
jgi:regulator of sigma E protease